MPDDIEDDLREAFRAEAEENLQILTKGLLAMENAGAAVSQDAIEEIFRAAHSLKGAARAVANWPLEDAAGAWEVIFFAWKRARKIPANAPFDLLQEMLSQVPPLVENAAAPEAERIRTALDQLREGGFLPREDDSATLTEAEVQTESVPQAEDSSTGAAEPGPEPAESSAALDEERTERRQDMVRISHKRLHELVIRADEAMVVKMSSRHQAAAMRRLSESFARIEAEVFPEGKPVAGPESQSASSLLLKHFHEDLRKVAREAEEHVRTSGHAIDELREKAQGALMRSASSFLNAFPKMVRDLSRSQGKRIELKMNGGHLPVDQRVLEALIDPMNHLVRNAVDHGIESPEERVKAGKGEKGILQIQLSQPHPGRIEIVVRDDGAGLPIQRLREEAVARGLLTQELAQSTSPEALAALVFESGFSTRREVSPISGRGLGLAIVREKIERLGGQVSLRSDEGHGTSFLITLPSTLVVFRGLSLKVAGQTFVLPVGQVEMVVGFRQDQLVTSQGTSMLNFGGELLPLVDLALLLQLPPAPEANGGLLRQAVVVRSTSERAALVVDEILREDDFPIRPFTRPLLHLKGILGVAVLPGGQPLPVLQLADLLESAFRWVTPAQAGAAPGIEKKERSARKTILVADDSITSRALLKNILEAAGYKVVLAVDGRDAMGALRLHSVDLVVSDVEMPRLNGFQLTQTIRNDPHLADLPVILVTALATAQDREKGLEAGANHYIVKTDFEQGHLIEAVQRLLFL